MSQVDKLIEQIRRRPPDIEFRLVAQLLEAFGWQQRRQRGSHVTFVKAGERSITIPLRGGSKVGRTYLKEICDRLGLDQEQED